MKAAAATLLVALAACEPTGPVASAAATDLITVSSGGFFGTSATQIFADGRVVQDNSAPGAAATHSVVQTSPATFAAAAAVIAAEGRRTKAALKPQPDQCLDYGIDQVSATPPIAGFDQVSTGCPDEAVSTLMDHVLAAVAQP